MASLGGRLSKGESHALRAAFDDVATFAAQCRFRDCRSHAARSRLLVTVFVEPGESAPHAAASERNARSAAP